MLDAVTCRTCEGTGEVSQRNPIYPSDPQWEVDARCEDCFGTGKAHGQCDACGYRVPSAELATLMAGGCEGDFCARCRSVEEAA